MVTILGILLFLFGLGSLIWQLRLHLAPVIEAGIPKVIVMNGALIVPMFLFWLQYRAYRKGASCSIIRRITIVAFSASLVVGVICAWGGVWPLGAVTVGFGLIDVSAFLEVC